MEIRKTEGQRDIEKQDIDIRKVAHTLSGVKRSGRAGMAVTRFSGKALRFGCDQVKNGLRSKATRVQLKLLSPEQRRQWNSYSHRKQNKILENVSAVVEKEEKKQLLTRTKGIPEGKDIRDAPLKRELVRLAKEERFDVKIPVGKTGREMQKNFARGNFETVTYYTENPAKGLKKAHRLKNAVYRQVKREKLRGKYIFMKNFAVELQKEERFQRIKIEEWKNDEISFQEMNDADLKSHAGYATLPIRIKVKHKIEEFFIRIVRASVEKVKNLLILALPVLVPLLIFVMLFLALMPTTMGGEYRGIAHVSAAVEFYRPYLEKYAALYPGMENLVDLMLAMIMQEAGGESWIGTMDGDIMQSSESAGYPGPGYLTGEASIAQGVKYLATEVFNRAGLLEDPYNMDKTKLALQGYNYGAGYIPWALNNYGGYTEENAAVFSDMMAAKLGWGAYGDKLYVPHVLRYYSISWDGAAGSVSTSAITHAETKAKLEELASSWPGDIEEGRKNIITKGCTLVGYTTYDMYGEDTRSGKDWPSTLDCSSFVAWAYQKCGYTDVPYWSTTGTFLSSPNFRQISSSELKPGDIGLINWVGSGGSNHVGIFVGRDSSGTPMWLHCTSHSCSGSSVTNGPRISYYSSFSLFFRYTGFH